MTTGTWLAWSDAPNDGIPSAPTIASRLANLRNMPGMIASKATMDFGISTRCYGTNTLTSSHLDRLLEAEFSRIEVHAALPGYDYRSSSAARDIARWFADNSLPAPSLHLPYERDILATSWIERQQANDDLKRCLEIGDRVPLAYTVLHLGSAGQAYSPMSFEYAYASIAVIQSFSGARVLLETLSNEIATPARLREFQIAAQLTNTGICYDTYHGEMEGTADAIHLNDSRDDGSRVWPFEGNRNWPALVEQLTLSEFSGPVTFEAEDDRLHKAVDARSRLSDLMAEATSSIEEFRLKYKLPFPKSKDDE